MTNRINNETDAKFSDFVIRPIKDEREFEKWLELLEICFSSKGTPKSYFQRHFNNDPYRSQGYQDIWVAEDPYTEIFVSTIRLFRRQIQYNIHDKLSILGIGEICTLPNYRKNGLIRSLITTALQNSESNDPSNMKMESNTWHIVCLHCGPTLFEFYGKLGFLPMPAIEYLDFINLKFDSQLLNSKQINDLNNSEDSTPSSILNLETALMQKYLPVMASLYQFNLDQNPVLIGMCRSQAYWEAWIQEEIIQQQNLVFIDTSGQGYAIVEWFNSDNTLFIKDFVSKSDVTAKELIAYILNHYLLEKGHSNLKLRLVNGMVPESESIITLLEGNFKEKIVVKDEGWRMMLKDGEKFTFKDRQLMISRLDFF